MMPIGVVHSSRAAPVDDRWLAERASVELDATRFTAAALDGLAAFSHVLVIFLMDRVEPDDVQTGARHPRGRRDWPLVGIFAQRAKSRPNRIGLTCCRLLRVDGLRIDLEGLDAIDRTPVLDIKPWVREFGPRGDLHQPAWISELMTDYYSQ